MGTKPKTGPKLFGIHAPTLNLETLIRWEVGDQVFHVRDIGRSWAFEALGSIHGGYETKEAAKRGLQRSIQREHKALGKVMGLS